MVVKKFSCLLKKNVIYFEQKRRFILRGGVTLLKVSYKKLWKMLIDKDMKKKDLQELAGISWASVTKLSKNETVSMEVLMKVCGALKCDIGDIMELISVEHNTDKQ